MCNSRAPPPPPIEEESGGLHIFELHLPSVGISFFGLMMALVILAILCYILKKFCCCCLPLAAATSHPSQSRRHHSTSSNTSDLQQTLNALTISVANLPAQLQLQYQQQQQSTIPLQALPSLLQLTQYQRPSSRIEEIDDQQCTSARTNVQDTQTPIRPTRPKNPSSFDHQF